MEHVRSAAPCSAQDTKIKQEATMDQFVAVIFPDQTTASRGVQALKALRADGAITPSGMAVVVKEPSGQWLFKTKPADRALATVVTALIGGVAGAAVGPVGAAIGAAGGALVGHGADLIRHDGAAAFIEQVARHLAPGQAALVAEIPEEDVRAFTERMQTLDGRVLPVRDTLATAA
jgi:uncharacterized membrane protein